MACTFCPLEPPLLSCSHSRKEQEEATPAVLLAEAQKGPRSTSWC